MTREEAIAYGKEQLEVFGGKHAEFIKLAIEALEMVEDFERPQIITGGRLNGRTFAYKCGLEDGKRKVLEQEPCGDCISRADALRVAKNEYLRGWHNALCKALSEKYSIHCEEGNFSVIQEETITGLGLSMDCAVGKDVESYMSTMPSVVPTTKWISVSEQLPELGQDVLGVDSYNELIQAYTCDDCGEIKWVSDRGYNTPIVAWRPLPEPFKEEKE